MSKRQREPSPSTSVYIPGPARKLIQRAAESVGASMNAFIVSAAIARARRVVELLDAETAAPVHGRVPVLQARLPPELQLGGELRPMGPQGVDLEAIAARATELALPTIQAAPVRLVQTDPETETADVD